MENIIRSENSIGWTDNGKDLSITANRKTYSIEWDSISAACLMEHQLNTPQNMPTSILPGMKQLININEDIAQEYKFLSIARGKSFKKMVQIAVPCNDPELNELVLLVKQKIGSKWKGENLTRADYLKALDVHISIITQVLTCSFLIAAFPFFLLALGAFASLQGILTGDIETLKETPLIAWISLGVWVSIVLIVILMYMISKRR